MRKTSALLLVVLIALLNSVVSPGAFGQTRVPIIAKHGMVVSADKIASEVGVRTLREGGNAVDAAIATAFALAVTYPSCGNIGGGGFLAYHGSDGTVTTFDFREKAPLAASETMFLGEDGEIRDNCTYEGLLSVGVPGTVAGLALAHRRLGSKPWSELIAPAIHLAEDGFPMPQALHDEVKGMKDNFLKYPSSAKVFLKDDGTPYETDELWRQPDLAAVLRRIQENGKDGFYKGRTAKLIADFMKRDGGLITEEDLAKYEAVEREPIHGTYHGYDIYAMGPPSSGGIALVEMLNILEGFNLYEMGHNSALYLHILTEAMRRAYADRARHLGDPDFNPDMPIQRLLSKQYADDLRGDIQLYRASESTPQDIDQPYESTETTPFVVVDAQGNAVSLVYSLGGDWGCEIAVEGAGFLLNNEMSDFNPIPGRTDEHELIGTPPNLVAPGKRMLSSITPTIIAKEGKVMLIVGCSGGRTIINVVLQIILNTINHKMDVAEAISAPRIHHQWLPDITFMEKWATTADSQRLYEMMGHRIRFSSRFNRRLGTARIIHIDNDKKLYYGVSDPRSSDAAGAAVGY
jgi:gamma-glutamyltranspeptidase/glutathione hydrolase